MRDTDTITINREEYDELIQDQHSLEMLFNYVEAKSYIDEEGNLCLRDVDFLNQLQIINPWKIKEIDEKKSELFEILKKEAEKIAEEAMQGQQSPKETEHPEQTEQENKVKEDEEF